MDENQISEEEAMNSILIENNEQETEICLAEKSAQCEAMIYDEVRPISSKRRREEDEEESRVKYVNAYKVCVQFECAESADELMNCTPLKELGWRFQKPLEVAFSYGVIKDIELEMSEKEMLEWNSQSIKPKRTEFDQLLNSEKIHIAAICETWLNAEVMLKITERRLALDLFRKNPTPDNLDKLKDKIRISQQLIRKETRKSFSNFCSSIDESITVHGMWQKMKWLEQELWVF
ncbi:unnamed protein product [Parnassius apollo]|uniref:(apollo) hypothetical protein n=1 Tax=Parnassius apollo TaxID=110799 RepID=A0A8S3W5Z1_PARAO|nr:unnamed protein product [Parnassius apollo]